GYTGSSNAIATAGSHQNTLGGGQDVYLVKFNASGVRQWATYYGGGSGESNPAVTSDVSNNVYLMGRSYSTSGIATSGSHQTVNGGGNVFLVKFNAGGIRQWAT